MSSNLSNWEELLSKQVAPLVKRHFKYGRILPILLHFFPIQFRHGIYAI